MRYVSISRRSPQQLTRETREQMWQLYAPAHHITREAFEARLESMDEIALCHHQSKLVGLIGLRLASFELAQREVRTLYFGQVFIAPAYRGNLIIQRLVITLTLELRAKHPGAALYFWSDALTYKPYLVMANHLRDYYPREDRALPEQVAMLRDALGERYYGADYDPQTGTVQKAARRVREGVADITRRDLENRHIRFYAQANAGHARGDGLIILCDMSFANIMHCMGVLARRRLTRRQRSGRSAPATAAR